MLRSWSLVLVLTMMDYCFSSSFVTPEEFKLFHSIDRELYSILVITLWKDPVECMQIMSLWIWLERVGFGNIVDRMLSLPSTLINELADEALTCLNYINNGGGQFVEGADIPLTQSFLKKEISLQFFVENRLLITQGVTKVVNEVCTRALKDIMNMAIERNAAQSLADSEKLMANLSLNTPQPQPQPVNPNFIPTVGGIIGSTPRMAFIPSPEILIVPAEDRTMFVTFSKGYPVSEYEVQDFFARTYGDCIESLHMQEVRPSEQALFARIVFRTPATINFILNGMMKAKFTINGKHVWARKFVPKRPGRPPLPHQLRSLTLLPQPPPSPRPPPF